MTWQASFEHTPAGRREGADRQIKRFVAFTGDRFRHGLQLPWPDRLQFFATLMKQGHEATYGPEAMRSKDPSVVEFREAHDPERLELLRGASLASIALLEQAIVDCGASLN